VVECHLPALRLAGVCPPPQPWRAPARWTEPSGSRPCSRHARGAASTFPAGPPP
jgi:hypothetical protein